MYREEDCGCGGYGRFYGGRYGERQGVHGGDCRCGEYEHYGLYGKCHHHSVMGFRRRFVSREEVINNLEEYLKQLQAEAKGVEEYIAKLKEKGESQQY